MTKAWRPCSVLLALTGLARIARTAVAAAAGLGLLALAFAAPARAQLANSVDCAGPAPDAEPGTLEWTVREANSIYCASERHLDQLLHPVSALPLSAEIFGLAPMALTDAYREPERHDGKRFRFRRLTITNRAGDPLDAEIYRPCGPGTCAGMSAGLRTYSPRFPGVVVLHGGGSRKELHWWSAQTLAEAGYMAVIFNGAADDRANGEDVLDWLLATPRAQTAAGEHNPFWRQLDRRRIGLAGHSRGGQTASVLGQDDRRVSAIVSWDRGSGLALPDRIRTPTLFFVGDYACQANPVCQPEPYLEPPAGEGPGQRGREYDTVRAARVDAMKLVLRASTHLDWTPSEPSGNRHAELVSVYFTLAWFDRYLKGRGRPGLARRAFRRLVGRRFDAYADRRNISQGRFDPLALARRPGDLYAGNVPYRIADLPVADRLSFYFRSKCFLRAPRRGAKRRFVSNDLRARPCRPRSGGRR